MVKEIILPWEGQTVHVQKKRIKNVYLRVLPPDGVLQMSVPVGCTREDILDFLEARREWVAASQSNLRERQRKNGIKGKHQYVTGEKLPLWGKTYELVVRETQDARAFVAKKESRILLTVPAWATCKQRQQVIHDWYRSQLQRVLPQLRRECESIVGRSASEWRLRDMHTRWGTCNVRACRVWLSIHLAKQPPEAVRYVALHELTHLWEASHGPAFKARMDRYCPDWRRIRQQLNEREDFE